MNTSPQRFSLLNYFDKKLLINKSFNKWLTYVQTILEESNLGLNQPKIQCLTQTRVGPIMKNIDHSSNCDVEIYLCLFAPSKPAPSFTLSIHLIFKISSLLIFVIPILKMSKIWNIPPQPNKPTQTLSTNNPFNTSK